MRVIKNWKHLLLLLTVMAVVFSVLPAQQVAAAGFNLTLSPLPISLVTKPGQTVTTPVQVQNTGTDPVNISLSVMKFGAFGNTGEPSIEEPGPGDTYVKWVSFSKSRFVAMPGVLNTVTMTIKVPKDAAFGYYFAVVFNQEGENAQPTTARQNKVNGAVASLVLLDVDAPGAKRELEVTGFKSDKKIYQYLPASFTVTVKNIGNVHAVPRGNIFISRDGKNFIGTLSINKEQGNVLPNSNRIFKVNWEDGFPQYQIKRQNGQIVSGKDSKPVKELNWNLAHADKLRFGRYVASMTLVYNDGKQDVPIEGEVSFWVIPWIPLIIFIVITLLVLFGLFVMIRSFLRRFKKVSKKKVEKD